jgi:hypothetical protein
MFNVSQLDNIRNQVSDQVEKSVSLWLEIEDTANELSYQEITRKVKLDLDEGV